jgi:hypothetical protein
LRMFVKALVGLRRREMVDREPKKTTEHAHRDATRVRHGWDTGATTRVEHDTYRLCNAGAVDKASLGIKPMLSFPSRPLSATSATSVRES